MNTISLPLASSPVRKPLPVRFARTVLGWFETHKQRGRLADLPKELLDDVGLTQADIRNELKRPVWDAPVHFLGK